MSDYLGPNQTRVLDSENRNFESVTYQKRKPPLSSEMDLGGKIDAERDQKLTRFNVPSGWGSVGRILDAPSTMTLAAYENTLQCGDVVCSPSLVANSFRLLGKDYGQVSERNEAIVNGNRILVQGTNTTDENNTIILNPPPSSSTRVDFVFLEVWRQLVYPTDSVYKYGNRNWIGTALANDLVDPAMGIETSLRIQLQYRVRVVGTTTSGIDIVGNPEGFDPAAVFVQGPLPLPNGTCSHAYFSQVPGDVGLWIAGPGDVDLVPSVDGYTYAIPMFAIRRRNSSNYHFNTMNNGAGRTVANYNFGIASDRPDNFYSDWIVAEDILDLRHRVSSGENLKEICEAAFKELIGNRNRSKMYRSSLGENPFGTAIVQTDAVSDQDLAGSQRIAQGDSHRRVFSNATMDQPSTFIIKTPVGIWANGTTVTVNLSGYPTGSVITAIGDVFNEIDGNVTSEFIWSGLGTDTLTVELDSGTTIIGTSNSITIEYTIQYPSSSSGLSQVPTMFLQSMREDSTRPQAMEDLDIRVRTSAPVIANDGTHFNMLRNHGGRATDNWNFGHQMVYHALGTGSQIFTVPKNIEGYDVIGIGDIRINGSDRTSPTVIKGALNYTIDVGFPAVTTNVDIECTLYTKGKFFTGNKQGRAITDCFEMAELTCAVDETNAGTLTFHIDGGTKEILALCSYVTDDGYGCAYDAVGTKYTLENQNKDFPLDSTRTYAELKLSSPLAVDGLITVPVMLRSAIDSSEGYSFFYKTVPYQGLLDSTATGRIEAEGMAITTSAGSGTITNFTYVDGQAQFNGDSTVVDGTNTSWASYVHPGYVIKPNADSTMEYLIREVYSDTKIFLDSPAYRSAGYEDYTIEAKDQAYFSNPNIIDIFPTLLVSNDSSANNVSLALRTSATAGSPVLENKIIGRDQDISSLPVNTVSIGQNTAGRGRSTIHLPEEYAPLGLGNMGNYFYRLNSASYYKKTFQSYILNKNNTGRLYLMVVGSETENSSSYCYMNLASNSDVVDIFELPGRPILAKRVL